MTYMEQYQSKLTTPEEAVKVVQSGDWVDFGWCTTTPEALDQALAKRYQELTDVKIRGGILFHKPAVMSVPDVAEHFTWNSWHMSGVERKMIAGGATFYAPIRYSELPRYYRDNVAPIHVAMFQVAPMDAHGYFSFGPSASHMAAVCERSEVSLWRSTPTSPAAWGARRTASTWIRCP